MRDWRVYKGVTLEEMAPKCGVTHGQLSKIERGLYPYNQRILEIYAKELGITDTDLLSRKPTEPANIIGLWADYSDSEKERALAVLKAIKGG